MTIRDLLNKISKEKPNSFSEAELISFVNEVEAEVAEEAVQRPYQLQPLPQKGAAHLHIPAVPRDADIRE